MHLEPIVIDLHEHNVDVACELGQADDSDDSNAPQGQTPPREPGVQRGSLVLLEARVGVGGQRLDVILTEEKNSAVLTDEYQPATPAVLQHQAERTIAFFVVERPLLEPPGWAPPTLGAARESEEDDPMGVLLDLAA